MEKETARTPRTVSEAKEMGWTVDRLVYPWVAYLGPRFDPDCLVEIETPSSGRTHAPRP